MKKIIIAVCMMSMALYMVGCNTVHGVGKDVSRGGHDIERAFR